jgi:hypothetical protein
MTNLRAAFADYRHVAERLRAEFPGEDEETLCNTILGETYLDEAIMAVLREAQTRVAMAEGLDRLIDKMRARQTRLEATAERLKHAALWAAQEAGLPAKISAPDFTASIVTPKFGKVVITDQTRLPARYVRTTTVTSADMRAIGQDLKLGEIIPGAELGNRTPFWTIRR